MFFNAIKRGWAAYKKATPRESQVVISALLLLILLVVASVIYSIISATYAVRREYHSPAEQLKSALTFCPLANGEVTCTETEMNSALGHLDKIMPDAQEHAEAEKLRTAIQALRNKKEAEHDRLMTQSEGDSRLQMERNVTGELHDPYRCETAAGGEAVISFDYGSHWWPDDGRCAIQQAQAKEIAERKAEEQRRLAQQRRDQDAQSSSYWSTTLRVDTDFDSSWLPGEERTCMTYPDANGRVGVVSCTDNASHKDHNIEVKFWGGVDRNTVSQWKCRREGDEFVCRAIN